MHENLNMLMEDLNAFYAEHKNIISQWEAFQEEKKRIEEELKLKCKEDELSYDAGVAIFEFVPAYKKWIDYDEAARVLGKKLKPQLDEITTFKAEVDMKKFVELTREGVFPEIARIGAYREEALTPKVLIKYKKAE